jgi:hypothetical protein
MGKTKATAATAATVPVTARALFQRVNRKLAEKGQRLNKSRSNAARAEVGEYYVIDTSGAAVARHHVNLVELAREVGAIEAWERLEG